MLKYLLATMICICLTGCESKNLNNSSGKTDNSKEPNVSKIVQKNFKGMFDNKDSKATLTDCESGRSYAVDGDVKLADSLYKSLSLKDHKRKLYITAEGFNSVKENQNGKDFDTVIVITRLTGTDTTFNCEK